MRLVTPGGGLVEELVELVVGGEGGHTHLCGGVCPLPCQLNKSSGGFRLCPLPLCCIIANNATSMEHELLQVAPRGLWLYYFSNAPGGGLNIELEQSEAPLASLQLNIAFRGLQFTKSAW